MESVDLKMKRLLLILTFFMAEGLSFASGLSTPTRTPIEKLTIRLRQMHIQISRDEQGGKLTKAQAKTLRGQAEAIRKEENDFLKQNGTKTLTDAQIAQLNQELNILSKSIPIR